MRPSKKRKEAPPNCTLLDFFSSPDAIKRTRTLPQLTPSALQTNAASREIIVIDSDSDDSIHGKKNGIESTRLGDCKDSQSLNSVPSTSRCSGNKDSFGEPSELLRPTSTQVSNNGFHTQQRSARSPAPDQSESMFGVSAPLLERPIPRGVISPVARENSSTIAMFNESPSEFLIEEWAAGDDEVVALELSDNGTRIEEDEEGPPYEQRFCPLCGLELTESPDLEAEIHVNQCLDTPTLETITRKSVAVSIKPDTSSVDGSSNTLIKGKGGDLFSVLMNSHKDNEIWVEAEAAAGRDFKPTRGNRRNAPFYKVLQGMPIAVDAFCYGTIPGVTAYFLTHAHSDHYTSLGSKWKSGPIYCSEETAKLIVHMLAIDPSWIHPLPLDAPTIIPNTGGVTVTLIEANHCPGSCLLFFEGQQTVDAGDSVFKSPFVGSSRIFRYLHCGDFRASPRHVHHPAVRGKHIDHVYLDTTYFDPKYTFPPQPLVISACVELARRLVVGGVANNSNGDMARNLTIDTWMKPSFCPESGGQEKEHVLVIVGTYSIGKERIVKAIAQALGTKIYCDQRKTAILRCQIDQELHALLTADPFEASVHLLPLGTVTLDNLKSYLQRFNGTFSRVIGFRPTGWSYSPPSGSDLSSGSIQTIVSRGQSRHFTRTDLQPSQKSTYNVQIFGVPYSEHSSFFELTCFAMSCDWGRMIPTVNVGNPAARSKMTKWLKRWESEKRTTKPPVILPRTDDYW